MLDCWQRIEQIIKWAGAASVSAFSRQIGLNRSENLYQIRRGNNGISRELADNIVSIYPQISKAWVLTGEGAMLVTKESKKGGEGDIPLYKSDVVEVARMLKLKKDRELQEAAEGEAEGEGEEDGEEDGEVNLLEPTYYISFPIYHRCDFAAFSFSDAMYPDIPMGSILFLERSKDRAIIPGSTYLIMSERFQGLRQVRQEVDSDDVRLIPKNTEKYDEMVMSQGEIEQLYLVRGVVVNM